MVISQNTQLGLQLNSTETRVKFLMLLKEDVEYTVGRLDEVIKNGKRTDENTLLVPVDNDGDANLVQRCFDQQGVHEKIKILIGENSVLDGEGSAYYYICNSVYEAADLIRINSGFTGTIFKGIKPGKYTYLMGKDRCVRFVWHNGAILGFYYDQKSNIAFEWGIDTESGKYYFSPRNHEAFSMIMQTLTFIELGDIDVKILDSGRNNGKPKNNGKVTNTTNRTVYVVDSAWNTIVVRTEGFAVRGHFRLQPCGINHADRKLIWIDAFEKHGYKRRPTGEIVK